MRWLSRLWARLVPEEGLDALPTVDRVRFITLLNIGWFGLLMGLVSILFNIAYQHYDRAFTSVFSLSAYLLPTLWLTYRYKLYLASWYLLGATYISTVRGFYARLMAHADVHLELHFMVIGVLSIILLDRKSSWFLSTFMAISYLAARLLIFHFVPLPFEVGQLLNGALLFITIIYAGHIARQAALHIQQLTIDQNEELSALNSTKNKLFAIVGHDLRSPLAALKVQLSALAHEQTTAAGPDERYTRMLQLADDVYNTTDNLLSWSTLQRGTLRSWPTSFDLPVAIEAAHQLFGSAIQQKQLTVNSRYEPAPVTADEQQLHIVARNLLHNAIKFTPPGGRIRLSTGQQNGRAVLTIQDSGIGMSPEKLASSSALASERGTLGESGTGLGLDICREFVRLNKGELLIDSAPGNGTTVTVRF
ncbi:sensor histidine kinase [Fibrella arboris]|uniref:sensor histidine kinase n=1 Tax=Fibrella arboris TaxID=3242486 RepID=UPI0035206AFB